MSNYSVLCIGCNKPFGLICKNCEHNQFTDTSKNPSKKSIQCNKCGKKVAGIKHKCWAFWSDPKPKTTYVNHNPERFTNLSQSSFTPKHSKEKGAKIVENLEKEVASIAGIHPSKNLNKETERLRKFHEIKAENARKEVAKKAKERTNAEKIKAKKAKERTNAEKIKIEERRIMDELKKSDPIYVLNRQLDDIKKTQEKILNDLESKGCLLYLLSNSELHDYAKNTGIDLNYDQGHFEVMHQIALAEGNIDTSQANWNFKSMDAVILKRFRKIYKNKVKYVKSANDQLNHLKSRLKEANRIKKKQEEKDLKKEIKKYKIELEIEEKRIAEKKKVEEKRIAEKKKVEEKRIAENLRKEEVSKAKENLKKRFF